MWGVGWTTRSLPCHWVIGKQIETLRTRHSWQSCELMQYCCGDPFRESNEVLRSAQATEMLHVRGQRKCRPVPYSRSSSSRLLLHWPLIRGTLCR